MEDRDKPVYMIGVAADLAGMHPQTLRVYEQKGLVEPKRSKGNTRLYSQADVERLEMISQLTSEGINLSGVIRIIDMQKRLDAQTDQMLKMQKTLHMQYDRIHEYELRQQITAITKTSGTAIEKVS